MRRKKRSKRTQSLTSTHPSASALCRRATTVTAEPAGEQGEKGAERERERRTAVVPPPTERARRRQRRLRRRRNERDRQNTSQQLRVRRRFQVYSTRARSRSAPSVAVTPSPVRLLGLTVRPPPPASPFAPLPPMKGRENRRQINKRAFRLL